MKIAVFAAFLLIAHHAFVSEAQNLTTVCGQQINRYNTGVKTCNVASDCNGYYYVGSCWTWKCDTSKWDPNNQLSYDCGICTQTPQPDGAYCNNYSGSFCTGSGSGTCYSGVCTQSTQYQTGCTSDETCDDRLATCTSKTCETGYGSRIRYSSPWGSSSAYSVVNDLTYSGNRVVAVGSTGANELNYPNTAVLSKGTGMEVLMTLTHPSDLRGLTLKFSWGGNGDDSATAIAVSSDYRAYIVGSTKSSNYPSISAPSFLTSCGAGYSYGIASAFVTALNLNPTLGGNLAPTVIFSGCWGYATLNIEISDIGINTGFYYIVGSTTLGANFPSTNAWTGVTYGAAGNKDGFIRKISRSTNSVAFSSRWGTSTGAEAITSIEVNPNVPTTATGVEFVLSGTTTAPASYYTTTTTSFCTQGTVPSSVTSLGFYITGNAAYSYPTLPGYSSLLCNSNSLVDIPKLVVNWAYSNAFDVVVTFSSSLLRSIYSTGAAPPAAGITQNTVTLIQHIIGSPARPLIRSAVINRNVANVKLALSNGFVHMVGSWDAITAMDNININLKPDSINAPLGAAVYPMDHTDVYYKKLTYASLHSRPVVAAVFGDTDEDIPNAIAAFDNTGNAPEIYASQGTYIAQTLYPSQVAFGGFSLSGGYPKVFTTDSTQTGTGFITMLDPDCIDGKDLNRLKSTAGIPTAKKHLTEPKKKQARDLSRTRVYIIGDGIDNNFGNVPVYTTKQTPYDVAGPERSQTTYLASIIADVSPNVDIVLAQVSSVPTHVTPNAANHKTQLDAALLGIINDMDAIKAYYQYPSAIVYYSSHVASTVPSTWNTANSYATQLINRGAIIIAASGPEGMTNMENPAGISGTTTYWPFVNYGTGDANKYAIFVGAEYYSSNLGTSRLRNTNKGAPVQFFAPGIYPGVISKSSSFYQPGNVNGIARVGQLATTTTHLASETAGAITVGVVSAIIQNKLPEKLTHVEAIKHLQYYSTLRIDTDTGLPVPGQYSVKLPTAATCTDRSDLP